MITIRLMAIMGLFSLLLTACSAKGQAAQAAPAETGAPIVDETAAPGLDLDAYVGWYGNGSYDTVVIEKQGDGYAMSVGLYRLTSLDEGTVSASSEGVVFETRDTAGNPMTLSFYPEGDGYALRVDASTWPLLQAGTLVTGLKRTTPEAMAASYAEPDDTADATPRPGVIPPQGEGQIGLAAVVLCETLTLRQGPGADSKAVGTLRFGDHLLVTRQEDGWAEIFLSDDVDATAAGWVNADYILVDPAWYRTGASTPVYAWNDDAAPKVALLPAGTTLPILKDEGAWLIVSLRGATGWIHVGDG